MIVVLFQNEKQRTNHSIKGPGFVYRINRAVLRESNVRVIPKKCRRAKTETDIKRKFSINKSTEF